MESTKPDIGSPAGAPPPRDAASLPTFSDAGNGIEASGRYVG
ncbi:hypothetical protein [Fulvimarina sp. MAC8]